MTLSFEAAKALVTRKRLWGRCAHTALVAPLEVHAGGGVALAWGGGVARESLAGAERGVVPPCGVSGRLLGEGEAARRRRVLQAEAVRRVA